MSALAAAVHSSGDLTWPDTVGLAVIIIGVLGIVYLVLRHGL